ncbi:coiled-coil domain-containing protein 93 isoform X3 [Xiphophorus couchianus]|uniref:coiled-coil domain-containing protein 93 isoform X3 n=1 Tax=Xiphophorus couchianus TaxID=32473 RepID=UPI00101700D7|nr:coiled-coil domain-containing protein 93 isoform X3 [Xiphophorus couchianus]
MAATASVFLRVRTGSKVGAEYDQEGLLIQVESREDEEQTVKLAEILELLLAAGYFRARIKGLSPFDKVVGGMTWCITTCNFDIDVDLLFQENSTIGQKIALTEKIVSVLPKMKCPHRLEPHQIQGLDFIHIFPVIQWLVKRAIETREEMGDYVRAYSISQFQKSHSFPEEDEGQFSGPQAIPASITEVLEEDKLQAAEEGKLTASAVGQIVGLQSEEIKLIASEYAGKQLKRSSEERSERYGPVQQHRRAVASLDKQIQQKAEQLKELKVKHAEEKACNEEAKRSLLEATEHSIKLETEMKTLEEMEEQADSGLMEKLRALVTMNENLKQQEQQFRTHCREEMVRLQQNIEELKSASGQDTEEEQERRQLIDQQYNSDREKLQNVRLLMARRNREIAILQRKIDEVPSRAELTQYQKRFIELYSQVSATHKETKQFFTLYNTLDDKKVYLEKEVNLLNSIHDNFQQAMSSAAARDQFLRQMEQIVEGIKQSRIKMEKKKQENKMRRDQLNDEYLELLDKQRLYFKTVKDFKEECRKNEMLLSKLRAKGAS